MEWISVKDRTPTISERLGHVYDGKHIRNDVYFCPDSKQWTREVCRWEEEVNVTHWMPLPEKPVN